MSYTFTFHKIEPQAELLEVPPEGQLLYKVMTIENLLKSISGGYLYFNRVDNYQDLDPNDGQQLPKDRIVNESTKFERNPDISMADSYDLSRKRSYVCCFSMVNSDVIWERFISANEKNIVCVVFSFGKLREMLNKTIRSENTTLVYNGVKVENFLSLNYGVCKYIERNDYQLNVDKINHPIIYTYLKDVKFSDENELRVSLSALTFGENKFITNGEEIKFGLDLKVTFDFKKALQKQVIQEIKHLSGCDVDFLCSELDKLGIQLCKSERCQGPGK